MAGEQFVKNTSSSFIGLFYSKSKRSRPTPLEEFTGVKSGVSISIDTTP
jgi:hypothetical protein